MKKLLVYGLLFILLIFIQACGSRTRNGIEMSIDKPEKNLTISITSDDLRVPLKIIPITKKGAGPIFFETSQGITYINSRPDSENNTKDNYTATWNLHDRKISFKAVKYSGRMAISLSSFPDNDILKWGINIEATQDEYFTGLFERVVDGDQQDSWKEGITEAMDLRGQSVNMHIRPTLSLYSPFYLSNNGYGLFVKGTWPGHYDFCKEYNNIIQINFEGPSLDMILYTSKDPLKIVQSHTLEVGPPILPPKWTFGFIRWRDEHKNLSEYYDGTLVKAPYNSMVVEDILMMEALKIPCTGYWVDRPWAKGDNGYDDLEWNRERFPQPEQMIQWLDEKEIRFLLWIAPWVTGNMAQVAFDKGYNMESTGEFPHRALIDFTNPEAVKWWQEEGLAKVLNMGVKGFKLDRSEEIVPESRDIKVHDGRTAREMRNDYPVLYVKATHDIAKKIHGDDFLLFPRAAYTGSSKYSAFWGGDIGSPKEGLRAAIIAMQRSAIIGYPVWGSDIGGYWQGKLDKEVTARWLAFGCFSPIMELGPTENKGLWDLSSQPSYDPQLLAIWRMYAKIHTNLMDYSYSYAKLASSEGTPIVRPLFLQYPQQKKAWQTWQAYLYGPDILVFPIWQKDKKEMACFLPEGETWIDAWDKKEYPGGELVTISTPLYKIPIFIKKGSKTDLGNLNALYEESLNIAKTKPELDILQNKESFIY